jgi:hypothetical protein
MIKTSFEKALVDFKAAVGALSEAWQHEDGDAIKGYPIYLPSFDEFAHDVMDMQIYRPELPELPAVGMIVRARYALDGGGHFTWHKGWTGVIKDISDDLVEVECHRYLGPGAHEWENCRVISIDDARCTYENEFSMATPEDVSRSGLLALALLHEFEVV